MSNEPHIISGTLLYRLNDRISHLRTTQKTLLNDMENFQALLTLHYDIRDAMVKSEAACDPSIKLIMELDAIYEHLIVTFRQLHSRQKRRLLNLHSKLLTEELNHPYVNTPTKEELKTFSARVALFAQHIEIFLE